MKQFLLLFWLPCLLWAQAPIIHYGSSIQSLALGTPVALTPINTGGVVPTTVYGTVTTLAGGFDSPYNVATDGDGYVYASDYWTNKIYKIAPSGTVTVLAGSGSQVSSDGFGTSASFNRPQGIALDSSGNLYVADFFGNKIRKITPAGDVTTLAGSGGQGASDGAGAVATFYEPVGIALDAAGNVFVADRGNHKIRKITPDGQVTTFAGSGSIGAADNIGTLASFYSPNGLAFDTSGILYVADFYNHKIRKITPDAVVTTLAGIGSPGDSEGTTTTAAFNQPFGIAADTYGNIYVTDFQNNKIRKITATGQVITFAGSGAYGAVDAVGTNATFYNPSGLAIDAFGHLYVGDKGNHKVRKISLTGYTISPALPSGLSFDSATGIISGTPTATTTVQEYTVTAYNVYGSATTTLSIATGMSAPVISYAPATHTFEQGVAIAPVTPTNSGGAVPATVYAQVTTVASGFNYPHGVATDPSGNIYICDFHNHRICKVTPQGVVATLASGFNQVHGITLDASGNVFVCDRGANKVYKITQSGEVSDFAGSGEAGFADGQGAAASFNFPTGIAIDTAGNFYVCDLQNNRIRKITPQGLVSTLAGSGAQGAQNGPANVATFNTATAIAVDNSGNVYVGEYVNSLIRKITPDGTVSTYCGNGVIDSIDGIGTDASFGCPTGLSFDAWGNLYVADECGHKVRKITPDRVVTTLAGNGDFAHVDGVGLATSFNTASHLAVDNLGNLYVSDMYNACLRKITVTGYDIRPALPSGLTFDSTTGTISGTPSMLQAPTTYKITAYNNSGISATTITIGIERTTAIPDQNFEQALISLGYDQVLDGKVFTSHINTVTDLSVVGLGISDLTGIQDFTALETLDCADNQLMQLQIDGLEHLYYIHTRVNQLTSLNLTNLPALQYLYCNYNNLQTLSLNGLPSLLTLHCDYNMLQNLSLQNLPLLSELYCQYNQLSTLDLIGAPSLTSVNCYNNQLTNINVTNHSQLHDLFCQFNQLTSLNLNGVSSLRQLYSDVNQLTALDVSGLNELHTLTCSSNNLISLTFNGCNALQSIGCSSNQLSTLDVTSLPILGELFCFNNQLTSLNVHGSQFMTLLLCANNNLSHLDLTGLSLVRGMDCVGNPNLSCIQVSNPTLAAQNSTWTKDGTASYSIVCAPEAYPQTFCYGARVSNLVATGVTLKWYLDATGGTALAATTLLTTRTYYVSQTISGVTSERTAVAVTIIPKSVAGTISGAGTICSGSTKTLLVSANHVGSVQWQSSTANTTTGFTDIVGASNTSYNTESLTTTTYFRVVVTNSNCTSAISPAITVTVSPIAVAGIINGGGGTVCKAQLTAAPAVTNSTVLTLADYSGSTLVWKKATSLNGSYTTITGATGTSYTASNLIATTYFKVEVKSGACVAVTEPVVINVNPTSVAGTIAGAGTICYNTSKTLVLSATHRGTVQWQLASALEGPYTDILGETADALDTGNLTQTTWYRAIVTSGLCSSVTTLPIKVTVTPQSVAGKITGATTVCPGLNSTVLTLTDYQGKIQWQSSPDFNFTTPTIVAGTTATYTVKNISSTTYYRALVTNGTGCISAVTEPVIMEVSTPVIAGTVSGTASLCYGSAATLHLSGYQSEAAIQWQKATTLTGAFTNLSTGSGFATADYISPVLSANAYYRAKVTFNGCSSYTNPFEVLVKKAVAGTIYLADGAQCSNNPLRLAIQNASGTNFEWYASTTTNLSDFTLIGGVDTSLYQVMYTVPGTVYLRASVKYPDCTPVFTPIFTLTIGDCAPAKEFSEPTVGFRVKGYPNPFADTFAVDINPTTNEDILLEVYDMIGKRLDSRTIKTASLTVSELGRNYPTGVFNVVVVQGTERKIIRMVKQ
ncbi:putative Ig domain-containing protein [Flavobacterium sp. XGLA_31]|uniref:NHL domain-containing protein n=1 Tax=Flavobacterium sp. XGLA_31 TaxID=3447666 RepID=UPI003F312221